MSAGREAFVGPEPGTADDIEWPGEAPGKPRPDHEYTPWWEHKAASVARGSRRSRAAIEVPGEPRRKAEALEPIRVYSARDLAALELPAPAEQLAGPFIRRGMATLIGGQTGHGKTTWIAQAVKAAASGGEFLGEQAKGGARVLVLDLEQHLQTIQRVIREAGLAESEAVEYAAIPAGLALDKRPEQLAAVEEILAARERDLLVVDPFYKLHEADSNDELQARLLVALLRRWMGEYGLALLTATHCRKLPAGRSTLALDDLFGSSLFTRDPEIVLGIQRKGNLTKLLVFKSREPGLDHGQVFDMLYTRGHGFSLKPEKDPEAAVAEQAQVHAEAIAYVLDHPAGVSIGAVQKALPYAEKRVRNALFAAAGVGALRGPVSGTRGAKLFFPPNHAGSTPAEAAPAALGGGAGLAQTSLSAAVPPVPRKGVGRPASGTRARACTGVAEVADQAEADRIAEEYGHLFTGPEPGTEEGAR